MKKISFLVVLMVALTYTYGHINVSKQPVNGSSTVSIMLKSWTGYISDSHCGVKGAKDGHVDCANKCIKEKGASPVLVVGKKVYKIANPETVLEHAGHKVMVTGTVANDVITVTKVSMV